MLRFWKRNSKKPMPDDAAETAVTPTSLIELQNVVKAYQTPVGDFIALRGLDLTIDRGEFVAVVGKSGSGKSTLINMITGIDRPTSGAVLVDNTPVHLLKEGPMAQWRGRNVGVIFQFFQLLPMLSCLENVMLPMDFCDVNEDKEREAIAMHLLEQVEMADHAHKLPSEVSGGQQQRVAIARALANDPPILVADEPTGNLDSRSAQAVFRLFESLVEQGKTILMVTHDSELARRASRTITLADGELLDEHLAKVFPALPHDQLLTATRQIEPQTYAPGQVIIQAGDVPDRFYIVTDGKAEVLLPDRWGEQNVIATLQNGQYFGEMAILNGSTRNATVRASGETAVSLITLSPAAFHTLIAQSPVTRADLERVAEARNAANKRLSQAA